MEDRDLVARFQVGDTAAFDEIVAAYGERITRLVHRLSGWSEDVEGIVQDVFLRALQNLQHFRGDARLSTWLTVIAVNSCRSHRRRWTTRNQFLLGLWKRGRAIRNTQTAGSSADVHSRVRDAVRRLPGKYREPIVLRYFEAYSVREISEIMRLSVNAVEVRLSRARRRLKEMLASPQKREQP